MSTETEAMMRDPDQASRRAEFADFCGPNAAVFLRAYDQMRDTQLRRVDETPAGGGAFKRLGATFTPAAFFAGPVWYFYRKLWWWGAGFVVASFLAGLLPGNGAAAALGAVMAFAGKRVYVAHAAGQLARLRREERLTPENVRAAGGVSKTAAWVSGGLFALLFVVAVASAFLPGGNGQSGR